MNFKLKIWRQGASDKKGEFQSFPVQNVSPETSFLEMLDLVNEKLILEKKEPVAFEHDCREGICGACGMMINGEPHGPGKGITTCQLYMREFKDNQEIYIEPFRAKAFSVIRDLIVDRSAFDRIQQSGGYISVNTGSAPSASALPVSREKASQAFSAATCIGCGACVASCKNASASLFVSARLAHFSLLPQGQAEQSSRVLKMVAKMDQENFGACSHTGSCFAACPKEISLENIARMNKSWFKAVLRKRKEPNS